MANSITDGLILFAYNVMRVMPQMSAIVPLAALGLTAWVCQRGWQQIGDRAGGRWLAGALLVVGVGDGSLLALLPRLGLSFGPVGIPWFGMALVRAVLVLAVTAARRCHLIGAWLGLSAALALNVFILACEVYGLYIEPFKLDVTPVQITVLVTAPIRIVHLSDLHIERITAREAAMLETAKHLQPDLILMTGDYLNLSYVADPTARQAARAVLRELHARYGVYAIPGTPIVDADGTMEALFASMDNITVLRDEVAQLDLGGQPLYLLGVANLGLERDRQSLRALAARRPPNALTILMYHTPDLIETASELEIDLYLAGHTHGGQIRLPWFGALFTSSRYGKRYESGLYRVGLTQLYVSRGIGMEGWVAPRVRFLCPPEIVEFTLGGK